MTNLWLDSPRRGEEKTQINKIRNEKEVTMDTTEIQKTMREYYEQSYANKFENLEEMDKFLETYSLPKLDQEEINQLSRLSTRNEIEYVIKTLPTNKVQDQIASQVNSTKHIRKNLYFSSLKLFKRLKKKKHSQRHSMKPSSP